MIWLLSFIPDWIYHSLVVIGIFGIILSRFVPPMYKSLAQILFVCLTAFGVYMSGGVAVNRAYLEMIEDMKKKVAIAEERANNKNVEIQKEIVEKVKVVKEKGDTQIKYIDRVVKGDTVEIVKDMSQDERDKFLAKQKELEESIKNCPVPSIVIEEHNKAAKVGKSQDGAKK